MESSGVSEAASPSPMGTKIEKSKRERKLPAKFRDLPIQEKPKQYKTQQKKKLVLEKGESDKQKSIETQKKTQNGEENLEDVEKELAKLVEAEKKELLKKVSTNKRFAGRMSTGEMEKAPLAKRARSSIVSWASFNTTKSVTPPKDEDLPDFDPENFTPGYVPKTVKDGDAEYVIVVSGVSDTGLCGKYWGDMTSLTSPRRKAVPSPSTEVAETTSSVDVEKSKTSTTPKTKAKKSTPSVDVVKPTTSTSTPKTTAKKSTPSVDIVKPATSISTPKTTVKRITPPVDAVKPSTLNTTDKMTAKRITPSVDVEKPSIFATAPKTNAKIKSSSADVEKPSTLTAKSTHANAEKSSLLKSKKSRKKQMPSEELEVAETPQLVMTEPKESQECSQLDIKAFLEWEPELESIPKDKNGTESGQLEDPTESDSEMKSVLEVQLSPELTDEANSLMSEDLKGEPIDVFNTGSSSQDFTKEVAISQLKSNMPVEVMVDCYAGRDNRRWINMGKKAEGMAPDAVQYTRALRPAYHLLSFLRMKGHSSKGMSCTDKNTMVFVVVEGEVSVTIHATQFNAKKGDSFYVPPKNTYNLINEQAIEAQLSLLQFQYNGPLPTATEGQN